MSSVDPTPSAPCPASSSTTSPTPHLGVGGSKKKHTKADRAFIFSNHPSRKIALRLAYHGHVHAGLAKQDETENTVEGIVCSTLMRVRLIPETGPEDFSRCGRTDKGVSALGNCFSMIARASCGAEQDPQLPPLDYCNMLNNALPPTIRIVGFALVDNTFDARFSCVSRTYRYYFCHRGLNVVAMQEAAQYMLGRHDFRNFCKMDVVNVSNFERDVERIGIFPSEQLPELISYFELKANSFLYHQIRCTMEVLFLVGRGLEEPTVVRDLLTRGDAKPAYSLADGTPLILWDCAFNGIDRWHMSRRAFQAAERELHDIATALLIRATAAQEMRSQLFSWYKGAVDPCVPYGHAKDAVASGGKVVRVGVNERTIDSWSVTGCDWTFDGSHDLMRVRRRDLFQLLKQQDAAAEEANEAGMEETDTPETAVNVPFVPTNYVKLLDRETERTYDERVDELSERKRARYEANEAKKQAGADRYANTPLGGNDGSE